MGAASSLAARRAPAIIGGRLVPNIAVEDTIESSADVAWAKLADFGGLGAWAPGVTECKLEGSGVGSVRRITMGGMEIAERLESLDDAARTLTYSITEGPMPTENYLAKIVVTATGDGSCAISWSASFDAPGLSEEQAAGVAQGVQGSYQGMVDALKQAVS